MVTTAKLLYALTAGDVMSRDVVSLPWRSTLREAARLLRKADVGGAPVVDDEGRCIGMLSASDFLKWASDGSPNLDNIAACSFQVRGRLPSGETAVICTLAEGSCPLQLMHADLAGRRIATCLQPTGILCDWQQIPAATPGGAVNSYMTADVVSVEMDTPLNEVARKMVDAHIHRVPVLDGDHRPIGLISSTDLLAAVAWDSQRFDPNEVTSLAP